MKRIRWLCSYLYYRIEAVRYGFPDAAHYARYSADQVYRARLVAREELPTLGPNEFRLTVWENAKAHAWIVLPFAFFLYLIS